jgi:hypothetical protein
MVFAIGHAWLQREWKAVPLSTALSAPAARCPVQVFPQIRNGFARRDFYFLNNAAIFFRTDSSILISGGHVRLKPSPGSFFVASIPILLPIAISLVA